jgi:hypothetical protein
MLTSFVREERDRWLMIVAGESSEESAGETLYRDGDAQLTARRFELLEMLLVEISDPEDILTLAATLLRAAAEYVDRGAIYIRDQGHFLGLAGFGGGSADEGVNESIKGARIPEEDVSVLRDVAESGKPHRGKLKKTPANVELVQRLGPSQPSEVVVLPIAREGRVIAVFYGDNGANRVAISETTGLEILLGQAGRALGMGLEARARQAGGGTGG